MAITVAMRTQVSQLYVSLFGKAPDSEGLGFWVSALGGGITVAQIAESMYNTAPARAYYPAFATNEEIVATFYKNVLGRTADAEGLAFWTAALEAAPSKGAFFANLIDQVINETYTDVDALKSQALLVNKVAVAQYYGENNGNIEGAAAVLAGVTDDVATVAAGKAIADGVSAAGQTFTLTTGADTLTGTAGNDVINADETTLTALDIVNGGAGSDVMNLLDLTGGSTVPSSATVSSVETINIRAAGDVGGMAPLDVSSAKITGLTNLNVTQAEDVYVKAGKTTAVSVAGATGNISIDGSAAASVVAATADKTVDIISSGSVAVAQTKLGTGEILVDGGTDITVNASGANYSSGSGIVVGNTAGNSPAATADLPTGVVAITVASAATNGDDNIANPGIAVEGGSTVTVVQSVTAGADVATQSDTNYSAQQGSVTVTGSATTTTVTVNQSAESSGATAVAAIAGVKQVDTVVFGALQATESVNVGGLIFTASKALTAAEVASAFANLAKGATQGSASASNGVYSGVFGDYSTGAVTTASGVSSVQATAASAATGNTPIEVTDDLIVNNALENENPWDATVIAATNKTAGVTETTATVGKLAVVSGAVNIDGNITGTDVLATVSLDAFGAQTTVASDALTTFTLANSANDITVTNATATSLALNVNNLTTGSSIDLDNATNNQTYTTLNITATGKDSDVTLTAAAVTALTVAGDKAVDLSGATLSALKTVTVSGAAGLKLNASGSTVTAVTTADTSGNSTITIDADKATFAGGSGKDAVTLSSTTVDKAVALGGGDDTLTLASRTAAVVSTLSGGEGTDTLAMDAADAETLSQNTLFEGKVDGFEKLSLGQAAAASNASVDLANLSGISYVISKNVSTGSAAPEVTIATTPGTSTVAEEANVTVPALQAGEALTIDGLTVTATAETSAQDVMFAFFGNGISSNTLTVTGTRAYDWYATSAGGNTLYFVAQALGDVTDFTYSSTGLSAGSLTLDNMSNNATLELTDAGAGVTVMMDDATGTSDTFNIVTKVDAADLDFGTVDVAGVETLNITATDTTPVNTTTGAATISKATIEIADAAVKAVVVTGNANLDLTASGAALTSMDASAATGKVTFSSAVNSAVVKGSSAADTLTATANSQKLDGGAGADVLVVTGNLTELTGGAGADTFNIGDATTNVNSYATITDLSAGDKIKFSSGAENFAASKVVLANTAVFQDFANAAIAATNDGEVSWFQFGGDTYIIENVAIGQNSPDNEVTFTNGSDIIVKITGLVDLSTASFSASADTLLIV